MVQVQAWELGALFFLDCSEFHGVTNIFGPKQTRLIILLHSHRNCSCLFHVLAVQGCVSAYVLDSKCDAGMFLLLSCSSSVHLVRLRSRGGSSKESEKAPTYVVSGFCEVL